jgi:hypothetical protein
MAMRRPIETNHGGLGGGVPGDRDWPPGRPYEGRLLDDAHNIYDCKTRAGRDQREFDVGGFPIGKAYEGNEEFIHTPT